MGIVDFLWMITLALFISFIFFANQSFFSLIIFPTNVLICIHHQRIYNTSKQYLYIFKADAIYTDISIQQNLLSIHAILTNSLSHSPHTASPQSLFAKLFLYEYHQYGYFALDGHYHSQE